MTRALLITAAGGLAVGVNATMPRAGRPVISAAALQTLTPKGYKVEDMIACPADKGRPHEVLVVLSDADDEQIKGRPVMLLLVTAGRQTVVRDRVIPHDSATGRFWDGPPNYFAGLTRENVGGGDLILLKTVLTGGGSGSLHFFDFYKLEHNKLHLVRSFSHSRMERTYFALHRNAIYDAEKVCSRGEKHGKAYVYTCYLQVTEYVFDGQTIQPARSERMREQRGNRFLEDKYWFISVLKALQKNEIFAQAP